MNHRIPIPARALVSACLLVVALSPRAFANGEVKAFTQQTNSASCSFKTMTKWDDMCQAFYSEVIASPLFDGDGHAIDTANRSVFTDPDLVAGGVDSTNLDDADIAIACMHGSDQGANGWSGAFRTPWNGATSCSARRQEMSLGEVDLEELFLSSCFSMDKDDTNVWNDGANPT